ncbi:sensor histidine kinase [Kutzneria kofuensis]|uniref:histidine kinase n=1 Tax=Kutzneria kofuensis TaxID=103725 RepID=A0A7W9NJV5_9PSEU|nr:histidine kinase [Kutzneria kofuensis]MBB5896032.1 signal transduction histidine kinase [Kutzneria kofuensis]
MSEPRAPLTGRLRREHWLALDAVVALALAVLVVPASPRVEHFGLPVAAGFVLTLAATLPVAVRRIWPVAVYWVVLAACETLVLVPVITAPFDAVAFAIYPIATMRSRRTAVIALLGALAVFVAGVVGPMGGQAVSAAAIVITAWGLGVFVREHRIYVVAQREHEVRAAAARERLRIARELHDVVANGMSLIALQAGVAGYVLDSRPEEARRALASIEETSRAGLTELRQMLPLLRAADDGEPEPTEATPGLADLDTLVRRAAEVGVAVTVEIDGARPLAAGLELSAYRIVQEAITNVIKHAGPARVTVVLRYAVDELIIEVADDGSGGVATTGGHGILGMRERVALYGGSLTAGPEPDGGFLVRAVLPTGGAA